MTILWALKASAILGVAWILSVMLRRRSAAIRHLVWTTAAAAAVLLPLVPTAPSLSFNFGVSPSLGTGTSFTSGGRGLEWLTYVWACGAVLVLLRTTLAAVAAMRMVRSAQHLEFSRDVEVRESPDAPAPFLWGFVCPVIVLPTAANNWPQERRNAAILHELAHAERRDCWTLLLARAACALHWFNPLVWLAANEQRREQERACDDAVLRSGALPSSYARDLLAIARSSRELALAPVAAGRQGLEQRVAAILNPAMDRRALTRTGFLMTAIALAAMVAPIVAWQEEGGQKVSDGVTRPKLIYKEEPAYTDEARDAGIEGTVVLSVEIGKNGEPGKVRILRGIDPGLDANAVSSIKRWMFEPARKDGEPVAVSATIEVNFRLM